jgi:hypothetical protein
MEETPMNAKPLFTHVFFLIVLLALGGLGRVPAGGYSGLAASGIVEGPQAVAGRSLLFVKAGQPIPRQ